MIFSSLSDVLPHAKKQSYAIPQFNVNGYHWIEAILEGSIQANHPIIIGVTDRNVTRLGGYDYIVKLIKLIVNRYSPSHPIVLHLDHGQSIDSCKKAIKAGFSSVMYDGSTLEYNDNLNNTKKVVALAKDANISVEGEIGSIGGTEDGITSNIKYADPKECLDFIKYSGVDALAAALGSVHGEYVGKPNLQFSLMENINHKTKTPLVLHGASGIEDEDIKRAINLGHAKINYNTELNKAYANSIRKFLLDNPSVYDPKLIEEVGKQAIKNIVTMKINLLKNKQLTGSE